MKSIFYVIGIKHCGKSTVGKKLSVALNIPFFDLDTLIENNVGLTVREFYKKYGKEAFKKQEVTVLEQLTTKYSKSFVCATGGGISDNKDAIEILEKTGQTIFIDTLFPTVYNRIVKNGIPPFLSSETPEKDFLKLYNSRVKVYKKIGNIIIKGDEKIPDAIVKEIINKIKESEIARK